MLDLGKQARPDEHGYFHLQTGPPVAHVARLWVFWKRVTWTNLFLKDGTPGWWESTWLIGNAVHYYRGNAKVDATRTFMYWNGQLDDGQGMPYVPDPNKYVVTTLKSEMTSVRFFTDPSEPHWDAMGGS